MYLRTTKKKTKSGEIVTYYQLAHNERHPVSKKPVAKIIHRFGRADQIDRNELVRLCNSIARVCGLEVTDPVENKDGNFSNDDKQSDLNICECSVEPEGTDNRADSPSEIETGHIFETQTNSTLLKRIAILEETVSTLKESEKKFKTFFDNANDEIIYVDTDGTIIEVNKKGEEFFGYKREEVIGKKFSELGIMTPEDLEKNSALFQDVVDGNPPIMLEINAIKKDGKSTICVECNVRVIKEGKEIRGILAILRDATERKQIEKSLEKYRDHLEELVQERTINLEEANTALKVLLKRREEDKDALEKKMLVNVRELVMPIIEKVKNSRLTEKQQSLMDILEFNLNDIISPFVQELSSTYLNLTTTELRIANIIKQGKSTKEIAEVLNMSTRTIDLHRYNIRKKLGLNNKKASLATHLMALQ